MPVSDLHVVLGATGGIGRALVRELAAQGRRVRAVSRRLGTDLPPGVEAVAADVSTADGSRAACAGAAVVHHCAQPAYHRWTQDFPALNEAALIGAAAAGAKLVLADNLYAYAPPTGPLTEDTPQQPTSRKGAVRLRLADQLLDAHRRGTLRVAIGRASDYYGPGTIASTAGDTVFGAVLAGKAVRWPGRVDVPHALHHLPDIARGLITLADHGAADGRAWILPAAPALTPREFVDRIGAAAGRPVRISATPRAMMRLVGLFDRSAGELPDIWYQYDRPWTVDDGQFQRTFGPQPPTGWDEGIAATVDWYRGHHPASTRS
ncbi:NAD-dependent epimerase/dehydratase family protein [Pseudonocardia humida]|uniref:NAD-dependent epimerase/dehydratase family protein n=1 Tax=Pseudonocardia humida TaxID=2800819 RepID=A0ABT1AA24_9PSEU|nr:NAD-dependent epimerase/dehydratase family protein [Pseudonocardia humida]MCO1659793.1 NAD-dependent epimerase/dehydratase family protein [Pseudonocardia humida]